ncbi:cyclase family protein [Kitasatospora sp. GAS1066B]|uniref:cyclase family protein n=1 Tax=Kitasatospora sp. GAS1066B TaxID=3156271 RepID=UPI0035154241
MPLIDLSATVDAHRWEPDPITHTILSAAEGAKHMTEGMRTAFGVDFSPEELPGGEFLTNDMMSLTTHTGTHVDAPAHYGTRADGTEGRTIDQLPLDWFHRPGFVLDLRGHREQGRAVADAADLRAALDRIGYRPRPLDIALLHTGADQWGGTQRYFTEFTGLDGSATRFLLDLGIRVIGTDAFSLDAPFGDIITRYRATGDRSVLWPAHFAGREQEYCQIERLAGLAALPRPYGFTVSCFPVKIARAGAGWTRAVAHVADGD